MMYLKVLLVSMVTVSVLGCFYSCKGKDQMTDQQYAGRKVCFARVDLMRAPVRGYDEIKADEIESYSGTYFEAVFNEYGLIVLLKLRDRNQVFWVAQYEYSQQSTLVKEIWKEGKSVRIRWFSPKGHVTNEVVHAKSESRRLGKLVKDDELF